MSDEETELPTTDPGSAVLDQVVVVTGGGSGIGRAVCRAFAALGAVVATLDIDGDRAQRVVAELGADSRAHLALAVDVTRPAAVQGAIDHIVQATGRIDVLVNNAGVATTERFLEQSIASWRRDFAVNVEGPFLMTQAVARVMMRQDVSPQTSCRGKLINVSSPAAEMGRPLVAAYGASKAALNHLSKTSAVVLGEFEISTTVLYPGAVEDGMWDRMPAAISALDGRRPDEIRRAAQAEQVLERFQTAEEVGAAAVYIARHVGLGLNGSLLWSTPHAQPL
jgi:NAD(P)-dependent dehydrogenase (short-subunit alcohol dehydrogenase family)